MNRRVTLANRATDSGVGTCDEDEEYRTHPTCQTGFDVSTSFLDRFSNREGFTFERSRHKQADPPVHFQQKRRAEFA